ncbi:hypothetical protein BO83DRAFT_248749 [Aspergillus eucalypticola CBS 122712]|uniref:Uncharacterized protein n=1 Tax=Aspergillus eucalypticola (strain CBS 122712 / IBT 29274) TaxID=1448314 RepID=A0A317VSS1_ASPEC|nr:uncharacterized protein BO83DRAFT_248749 [Aspergillus eucalypticola CBS 122712]PWY75878.1 hypothetical protein BO83DRAFT_248749 [Aspergillus eucalypticola CBS 122712]
MLLHAYWLTTSSYLLCTSSIIPHSISSMIQAEFGEGTSCLHPGKARSPELLKKEGLTARGWQKLCRNPTKYCTSLVLLQIWLQKMNNHRQYYCRPCCCIHTRQHSGPQTTSSWPHCFDLLDLQRERQRTCTGNNQKTREKK